MGWWGMKPWESDEFGDRWDALKTAANNVLMKALKEGAKDQKYGDFSTTYAACGIALKLAKSDVPIWLDAWKDALDGIEEVLENVDKMGWRDPAAAKREIVKIRDEMREVEKKRRAQEMRDLEKMDRRRR